MSIGNPTRMNVFDRGSFKELNEDDDESDASSVLPPLGSRNAKWWYSAYHNIAAIVGAGVLGLPTTMVYLGWGGGVVVLVMSWVITLFTLWQLVQMHEMKDENGNMERFDTYYQLGQKAFGPKRGLWIVLPQQLVVQVGTDIVYMLTGGTAIWQFYQLLNCPPDISPVAVGAGDQCCGTIGRTTFIIFFALFQLVFAQLGNFNSIASLSLLASVTSLCYCTIAWADSLHLGKSNHKGFSDPNINITVCPTSYRMSHHRTDIVPHNSWADQVFGVFSALGVIAFAYAGHNVVLEIQSTLPSTSKNPSKIRMWRGVVVAYIVVAICYFPVAFAGYWAFGTDLAVRGTSPGNPRSGNILLQLSDPKGLIAAANFFVAIHVTGSYQVYAMPIFELMEKILVNKFRFRPTPQGCTSVMRLVTRSTYVVFTAFIAITFPFFSDLLAFVGGFALTPTTYFLPCIIWLRLKKPRPFSISWLVNWALIVIGVLLLLVATIGGMRNIIVDSSTTQHFDYLNCTNTVDYPKQCQPVHLPSRSNYKFYGGWTCDHSSNHTYPICKVHFQ
ncbi:unnamed protein product [Calypogeia fissa]